MLNSTCRTISVCKLLQIVNFDGLKFLTALVLFNQSDHFNHSNKDSGWLIVTCFIIEIKNAPSASLSYISTREFLRIREKCGEALTFGSCFSHFSSVLKNSQVLI